MRTTFFATALCAASATLAFSQSKLPPAATVKVDYEKDVQPLLAQKCYSCHGETAQQSGLRLDRRQAAFRGGDYGPVIIVGDSAKSKLIHRVANGDGGLQMPPSGPLSDEEIGILRAWIDQGADFRITVNDDAPPPAADPKLVELISAVRSSDMKNVEKLLTATPALLNAKDPAGASPLHHATAFGNLATMQFLLDKGADVNAVNRRKTPPLFWALHDEAKVRLLLDRGANVNARSIDGRTAVYQAAMLGNALPVLRLLLEKGGNPDAKLLNGFSPLHAAARGNREALRLLLNYKVDVNAGNAAGFTPLMSAAQGGDAVSVEMLLLKGANVNARTKKNETALAEAATSGNEQSVRLLLHAGADVHVQDTRGYTALLYAAGSDAMSPLIVKMLLEKGADPNVKGDGETAPMLAAKRGNSEVAALLGVSEQERKLRGVAPIPEGAGKQRSIAEAVKPALQLLEQQSHNFIRIGGCNSCHAQDLVSAAAALARERGLPAPKAIPQLPQNMHALNASRILDLTPVTPGGMGWELFDFATNRVPRDEYTDATIRYIKEMQTAEGNWRTFQGRRPPMMAGAYQTAALCIFSLKAYGPPAEKADTDKAIARAAAWLEASKPGNTQDRAFHLMGLTWANASSAAIANSAKALVASQRADGGWSQLPTMGSDAYATGQALYALSVAGKMHSMDAAYARGVKYLLRTQAPDGSWHVKTRSIWLQPYFDSGFPYAHDQWISVAGTSWAVMALTATVEPARLTTSLR